MCQLFVSRPPSVHFVLSPRQAQRWRGCTGWRGRTWHRWRRWCSAWVRPPSLSSSRSHASWPRCEADPSHEESAVTMRSARPTGGARRLRRPKRSRHFGLDAGDGAPPSGSVLLLPLQQEPQQENSMSESVSTWRQRHLQPLDWKPCLLCCQSNIASPPPMPTAFSGTSRCLPGH